MENTHTRKLREILHLHLGVILHGKGYVDKTRHACLEFVAFFHIIIS